MRLISYLRSVESIMYNLISISLLYQIQSYQIQSYQNQSYQTFMYAIGNLKATTSVLLLCDIDTLSQCVEIAKEELKLRR